MKQERTSPLLLAAIWFLLMMLMVIGSRAQATCPPQDAVCHASLKYSRQAAKCQREVAQVGAAYGHWVRGRMVLDVSEKNRGRVRWEQFLKAVEEAASCHEREARLLRKVGEAFRRQYGS